MSWDRLIEEGRLREEVTTQLAATQQRVSELTPLAEEADGHRSRVAKAHRHAVEAEMAFEALSARSWRDDEEAAKVRKERDELVQKDAKTYQWILDLLAKVEKQRELKLGLRRSLRPWRRRQA